jgi:hypothetical protein
LSRGGRAEATPYGQGETAHRYLDIAKNSEQFLASDVFLYWGDFIHSHSYWELDMNVWNPRLKNLEAAEREAIVREQEQGRSKYIFLSELSAEALRKVVVFGSTIITNEARDAHDSEYSADFQRFFSGIGNVYFRDALSAAKISPLRNGDATLSCDCALMLENSDLEHLEGFKLAEERKGVGVFFGRSPSKLKMLFFSKMVGRCLGEACHWLPWFPGERKMALAGKAFGYQVPLEDVAPGAILSALSGYRLVVTDTYHICINAWRMGIPAICIGLGAHGALSSTADKKKEIAYEQYGAREFYVFLESLGSLPDMWREAKRVSAVVSDTLLGETVARTIQEHRTAARNRLLGALKKALSQ